MVPETGRDAPPTVTAGATAIEVEDTVAGDTVAEDTETEDTETEDTVG